MPARSASGGGLEQLSVGGLPLRIALPQFQILRMWRQPVGIHARFPLSMAAIARPEVITGMEHHACAYRIEFDITHQRQQVPLALYHRRAVAPFPQGTGASVDCVEVLHIPSAHRLEDLTDRMPAFRACQQMNVVGHPDIGMDRQAILGCCLDQGIAKKPVVRSGGEDHLPVIAALNDVLGLARYDKTGKTRHVEQCPQKTYSEA